MRRKLDRLGADMIYVMSIVLIIAIAVTAVLLLRLRCRFEIASGTRRVFLGLGRSGLLLDFVNREQTFKLFGFSLKTSPMDDSDESDSPSEGWGTDASESGFEDGHEGGPQLAVGTEEETEDRPPKEPQRGRRVRRWQDMVKIAPQCLKALGHYQIDLLRALIIEELEAEIEAGFESPDLTGITFGYYQAALAAVPSVAGRIDFTPDWTGASFDGSARGSVAMPLYRMVWRSLALMWRLPLRDLIKLAIGKKEGGQDG